MICYCSVVLLSVVLSEIYVYQGHTSKYNTVGQRVWAKGTSRFPVYD